MFMKNDIFVTNHRQMKLLSDITKFKRLDADPINTRLITLKSYLQKLHNRNKISKEIY